MSPHRGWTQARHLPHTDAAETAQFITYRLADALPIEVARRLDGESDPAGDLRYRDRIEAALDAGHGRGCLTDPPIAHALIANWRHFDPDRYRLIAWTVMPNHVHVLIRITGEVALGTIVPSWKSWSGRRIRALLSASGQPASQVWQREYWDRCIRDERHHEAAIAYIHANPVKAGLCASESEWPLSSAAIGCNAIGGSA